LKEKEIKNMKLEKFGSLPQVVLFVSHTSFKNKNTMNTCVRISIKILRFPTYFFQKTKHGSAISSTIPSSLDTKNIFSFILVA